MEKFTHDEIVQMRFSIDRHTFMQELSGLLEKGDLTKEEHDYYFNMVATDTDITYSQNARHSKGRAEDDHTCES